jgi:hypothetical protein
MKRRLLVIAMTVLAALIVALPAFAITYGQADGNRHPNVGALVGTFSGQTYPYCSGTLVSPTVFVTAAHCDISAEMGGSQRVTVMFAEKYSSKARLYAGTFYPDPQYNAAQSDPHDLAVVVFDKPISGLPFSKLPTLNSLANLPHDQAFTAVGYGGQEVLNQPGGPVNGYLDAREFAVSTLNSTNPAWLRLSQNQATGDGGTCYGDSGGPNFLGAGSSETKILAATTITGDMLCKATNVVYRLDTAGARAFLGQFVALP